MPQRAPLANVTDTLLHAPCMARAHRLEVYLVRTVLDGPIVFWRRSKADDRHTVVQLCRAKEPRQVHDA
eukprot:6457620-Amphidinium_carterae.1